MPRGCGCGSLLCACCVQGGNGIAVTGNGSATACYTTSAVLSGDADNVIRFGSDKGLYVPAAAAQAGLLEGPGIRITGDQASGYTVGMGNLPRMRIRDCTNLAPLGTAEYAPWPWNTTVFEEFGGWTVNQTYGFVCPATGLYQVDASVQFYSDPDKATTVYWGLFTDDEAGPRQHTPSCLANYHMSSHLGAGVFLKAGEVLSVRATAQEGTGPKTREGADWNWLTVSMICPAAGSWTG